MHATKGSYLIKSPASLSVSIKTYSHVMKVDISNHDPFLCFQCLKFPKICFCLYGLPISQLQQAANQIQIISKLAVFLIFAFLSRLSLTLLQKCKLLVMKQHSPYTTLVLRTLLSPAACKSMSVKTLASCSSPCQIRPLYHH